MAYKKRGNRRAGDWRLAVMHVSSGKETQLTEQHSVDDQVEWLDNATILYGLPGGASQVAQTNVWALPTDGHGQPRLLIQNAWSPAVVRRRSPRADRALTRAGPHASRRLAMRSPLSQG